MNIENWDIFLANLNPALGNEQGWLRPIIILQKTQLNSILNTVFIIPITWNLEAKWYMLTYFIDKQNNGLKKDSIALVFQARCISKLRLRKKIWRLKTDDLDKIKKELNKLF